MGASEAANERRRYGWCTARPVPGKRREEKGPRTYEDNIKEAVYLRAGLGHIPIKGLRPKHVAKYLEQREDDGAAVRGNREKTMASCCSPDLEPGGEAGPGDWSSWITGSSPAAPGSQYTLGFGFACAVMQDQASCDYLNVDVVKQDDVAREMLQPIIRSVNPDLSEFRARGGKMIQYAGWQDAAIAPENGLNYCVAKARNFPCFTKGATTAPLANISCTRLSLPKTRRAVGTGRLSGAGRRFRDTV